MPPPLKTEEELVTLPEEREYFNSPSVYRGSTAKPGGSFKNNFKDNPFSFNKKKIIPLRPTYGNGIYLEPLEKLMMPTCKMLNH